MRLAGNSLFGEQRWLWLAILFIISLDQLSKQWMLALIFTPPRVIELTSFFNLAPVWNRGISFGLFASYPGFVRIATIILAAIVIIFLAWQMKRFPVLLKFASIGIIAGAAGNMIDRLVFGKVVDFLDFHFAHYHWPAFNIADMAISVGVFLWICAILLGRDNIGDDVPAKTGDDTTL